MSNPTPPPFAESVDRSNPYLAPQSIGYSNGGVPQSGLEMAGAQWVGDELYVPARVDLPSYCVFCNEPVSPATYKSRALYYQSPWLLLLILLNLLIFAIVSLIVRKRCDVTFGYCQDHRSSRFRRTFASSLGLIAGLFFIFAGSIPKTTIGGMILFGGLLFLGSLIGLFISLRTISVAEFTNGYFRLKGLGERSLIEIGMSAIDNVSSQTPVLNLF